MVDNLLFKTFLLKINLRPCFVEPRLNVVSVKFCFPSLSTRFFYKQPSCYGPNVKNGLKIKQLAQQPPTLKTPLRKNFLLNSV